MSKAILEIHNKRTRTAFTEEAIPLFSKLDLKKLGLSRRELRHLFKEVKRDMGDGSAIWVWGYGGPHGDKLRVIARYGDHPTVEASFA